MTDQPCSYTDTQPAGAPETAGNFTAHHFALAGPRLIRPRKFADDRGFFMETYAEAAFAALGVPDRFVQDNHSLSTQPGTVRGIHFQSPPHAQAKLVRVLRGAILDVAVDLRRSSPGYGQHVAVTLSATNAAQLYIPAGFGHGFCTLEPDTEIVYKVTDRYAADCDRNLRWNDPTLAIRWPATEDAVCLSAKDRDAPWFAGFESCFA